MNTEKGQTIIIHKKRTNYTQVPNKIFEDNQLSWKAKGILSYLIGRPTTWLLRISDLSRHSSGDGEDSIRSGLQELRRAGYVKLEAVRVAGKIVTWTWHVSDRPIFLQSDRKTPDLNSKHIEYQNVKNSPDREKPDLAKPDLAKPDLENRHISNTDSLVILIGTKTDVYKNVIPSNPSDVEGDHLLRSNRHRKSVMVIADSETEEGTDDLE